MKGLSTPSWCFPTELGFALKLNKVGVNCRKMQHFDATVSAEPLMTSESLNQLNIQPAH